MTNQKSKLLEETFNSFFDISTNVSKDIELLDQIVADNVMGYGTAIDEKIVSLVDFKEMIKRQGVQSQGFDIDWKRTPILRRLSLDGNVAIRSDDITLVINTQGEIMKKLPRFSLTLEFQNAAWKVIH